MEKSVDVAEFIDNRRLSPYQYLVIGLCALIMLLDGFDTQAISYAAPMIAKEWSLTTAVLGPIFSSALVGLMVGYLVVPPLSDRFGLRRTIMVGTLFFAIATLLAVFARGVTELMALRFLAGIGLGGVIPSAVAMTCDLSPKRVRATTVLVIYCGFSLGFIVAGFFAAKLLPDHGWRSLFWIGGLTPIVLTGILMFLLPESPQHLARYRIAPERIVATLRRIDSTATVDITTDFIAAKREAGSTVSQLFVQGRWIATLLLWLAFFIILALFYALQSWLPTILHKLDYSMTQVALTTSLTTAGGILIVFIIGPCMDRVGYYATISALYFAGAVIVVLVGMALTMPAVVVMGAAFLAGTCISGGSKGVIALAAVHYHAAVRSTGVGWALGVGRLGGITGPLVVGLAFSAGWTPSQVFYAGGVPLLIAGLAILIVARDKHRARAGYEQPLPETKATPISRSPAIGTSE
ncbi:MAG: MFS transporter [Zoogloeaceae bacterium]|jgi:AAHS family 4-hydroxybenzoate transporter-like MFS transporter|nr:MFS transporter [Zoogloeaceae bacterium]